MQLLIAAACPVDYREHARYASRCFRRVAFLSSYFFCLPTFAWCWVYLTLTARRNKISELYGAFLLRRHESWGENAMECSLKALEISADRLT